MVEVKLHPRMVDLPYMLHFPGISEQQFAELTDEDTKAELFDGFMIVHSPATLRHDNIVTFLGGLMSFYANAKDLGEVLAASNAIAHLASGRKFAADAFFLRDDRVPVPMPKEFKGAPDLVLEVLSPTTRDYDLEDKRPAYQEAGVGEIWFVDPDTKQVIVDRRRRRRYSADVVTTGKVSSTVIDGFWIDAAWLWAARLPNRMTCLKKILAAPSL
ncbi:MAG: Uma2 family endonuclease [Gemmataceae bacterium]|nr:Uma2 family endonuclease [Gemmataceae bacterium]